MIVPALLLAFVWFLYFVFDMIIIYIILVLVATIMSLVYFNQNKLLYMPVIPDMSKSPSGNPFGYRHPKDRNLKTLDLQLKTQDGILLRGWHVEVQGSQRIIIYFHQNAGNIGYRIPLIKQLSQRTNSDVILVAYRGYSDSQGLPTQTGLQKDGEAIFKYAVNYVFQKKLNKKIFIYGRSLGGAVSIYVATKSKQKAQIDGVILENTFTNISDMIDCIMPVFKYVKFLQRNYWKSIQRIPHIQKPILFIRSLKDQLIPTQQMVRLRQNAAGSIFVQQYTIAAGTHNCSWEIDKGEYFDKIYSFLENQKVK